ncbi:MAG TPA: ribbon-helix-helix domain-containing protein [Thermodesulfobacteriota bacterium]|nr:ribbon-helix-helix protein, CopG family [Deltaproteobacteria bacterium]HNR13822.1 ribbon-helix-helix domain-containing protein [Thermodesulfobacteriota bacterium]HNU71517.1 ribbon-helix-helix domain-containing protein [Thermodesulfobacteriota bacterium]
MTTTVNISFEEGLLSDIDTVAKSESRSRSELLREAARMYIDRKRRWQKIFDYGKALASTKKLSQEDVAAEIDSYRKDKNR